MDRTSIMPNTSTTTYHRLTWPTAPATTSEPVDKFNEVLTIGIPLVVIFLILLALCMMLLYSKARRRRAAAHGRRDPMTAISGGVAMNANAYMNYARRDRARHQVAALGDGNSCPVHSPYIVDGPPSYEDAMKEVNTSYNSGVINMSFTASSENLDEAPPSYESNTDQSGSPSNADQSGSPSNADQSGSPSNADQSGSPSNADQSGSPSSATDNQNTDSNHSNGHHSHDNMNGYHGNVEDGCSTSQIDEALPVSHSAVSQSVSAIQGSHSNEPSTSAARQMISSNRGDQEVPDCTTANNTNQS